MRIIIINPNSDPEMTQAIERTAKDFAGDDYEVMCLPTPGAPVFIETYEDAVRAAPGMIQIIRENEHTCDGFVVACHSDPHLDVIKEIIQKPVVGIGEASMKIASMLGHRFSVISDTAHSIPNKEDLAKKYHLSRALASVRAPEGKTEGQKEEDVYAQLAKKAIDEDGAEVLVLGCAGLTGLDKPLMSRTGAPVLDGIICALIILSGLIKSGLSTSKIRKYNAEAL
jgi:allantoin racemase